MQTSFDSGAVTYLIAAFPFPALRHAFVEANTCRDAATTSGLHHVHR